jgi:pimeloyl-ACP methyl ester carboxylesterase
VTVKNIAPENLVVMGRSLGSGVATYLSSQKPVRKVVLVTPYDSIENVAKDTYGYLPVSLLIRHRFESTKYARIKSIEMLCIYGGRDDTIRNPRTEKLLESWSGPVRKVFLPTATHHTIFQFDETKQAIDGFL